jgi:O-antigen/teichoic acid export membrane protein
MPLSSTMRRDVTSAYGATFARIFSWVIISAAVWRMMGEGAFALMSLVRATIGILNYTSLGLAPAMIRLLAEAKAAKSAIPAGESSNGLTHRQPARGFTVQQVYINGIAWALLACAIGYLLLRAYVIWIGHSKASSLATDAGGFVVLFGIGVLLRLLSDAPGAVLETSGQIALDNILNIIAEAIWTIGAVVLLKLDAVRLHNDWYWTRDVAGSFCASSAFLLIARWAAASRHIPASNVSRFKQLNPKILKRLLGFGSLVTLAQVADYLYAPTDFVLITLFLQPIESATYSPAVQIDAGLLMLVAALANVILPKTALAHVNENRALIRRYYLLGTAASVGLLLFTALGTWAISVPLFRLWFGHSMRATRAILPLVLIHTVIGGSSMVGRSILLGMDRVAPFTIAVLVAGLSNVLLSILFVTRFHMGLRGIILGTVCAVVGRCAIWMPWYVMRTLKTTAP